MRLLEVGNTVDRRRFDQIAISGSTIEDISAWNLEFRTHHGYSLAEGQARAPPGVFDNSIFVESMW